MRLAVALLFAGTLFGQAAVEAGLGASRAVTSTAPAQGLGKSIAGAFGSLEKTLGSGDKSAAADKAADKAAGEVITVRSTLATAPKAPAKNYEDVRTAEVGLAYDELVRRFGPPALEMAVEEGARTLTYPGKDGSTRIEVKDGKVSAVNAPAVNAPKAQPGVLVLPK